jgi:hydrogenase maturation protease
MSPRILIAGIGNIFFGDDGFGVEVVRRLAQKKLPDGVRVFDAGIRGLALVYELLESYDAAVLVDAVPRGGAPGTLYVLEPEADEVAATPNVLLDAHHLDPVRVLSLARAMGGRLDRVRVVGCEPAPLTDDADFAGLSAPVAAAVNEAVGVVETLIEELSRDA